MVIKKSRRIEINVIISLVISLTMVLPMILGMMGYDIFNSRQAPAPSGLISVRDVAKQFLLYFVMVFLLMTVNTVDSTRLKGWQKILAGFTVTVIFYALSSLFRPSPPGPDPGSINDRLVAPPEPAQELPPPAPQLQSSLPASGQQLPPPAPQLQSPLPASGQQLPPPAPQLQSPLPALGQQLPPPVPQQQSSLPASGQRLPPPEPKRQSSLPASGQQLPPPPSGNQMPPRPDQKQISPANRPFGPGDPDYRMMTEFLFILITTTLLGKVLELVNVKQQMQLENETLRSENLQNRYNVLLDQMNPHFFFNSLNSLSSLVREEQNEKALKYIEELSNTYRYAMQSTGKELVTVAEEVESLAAYNYLLHIRFEDKLFIETEIDPQAMQMLMPVLSLQPLIENAVKHNIISSDAPLTVTVAGNTDFITVMNPMRPRNKSGDVSGTGLKNLATRFRLLTGKDLIIEEGNDIFSVTLPLTKPGDI